MRCLAIAMLPNFPSRLDIFARNCLSFPISAHSNNFVTHSSLPLATHVCRITKLHRLQSKLKKTNLFFFFLSFFIWFSWLRMRLTGVFWLRFDSFPFFQYSGFRFSFLFQDLYNCYFRHFTTEEEGVRSGP